jgi:hypothetical protein
MRVFGQCGLRRFVTCLTTVLTSVPFGVEASMKCLRIYATADGESHFDEIEIPTSSRQVHPNVAAFELSAKYAATQRSRARSGHAAMQSGDVTK